ncbi:MAG: thermonuclease family protein, partial [Pseudomonadota bacterium]
RREGHPVKYPSMSKAGILMKRRYALSYMKFFFFSWLFLLLCHQAYGESFVVDKIISGNLIKLAGADNKATRIRYIGVDAPDKGKPFYELCRETNRELVNKKPIVIKTDVQEVSDDGKRLGYVYTGPMFINAELIKGGYGLVHILPPNIRYKDLLLGLQRDARKNRRGLWAFEDQNDEPYYVGSKSRKVFHRPSCFHVKNLDFDDRIIMRTKDEALSTGFTQDWRCCPLFIKADNKKNKN